MIYSNFIILYLICSYIWKFKMIKNRLNWNIIMIIDYYNEIENINKDDE